ncbi:hypothetical protein RZS08_66870, partial [Arthrospira platensis SPKY1]|nr:hypothetical protein [Arthrospira platensis SPKY1]
MKAQYDSKPDTLAKYDKQGRYLFRFNIQEVIIPADDFTPETVMWQCDEVVAESRYYEDICIAVHDYDIDIDVYNFPKKPIIKDFDGIYKIH